MVSERDWTTGNATAEVDIDGGSEGRGRLEVDGSLLKTVIGNGGDLSVHLDRDWAFSPRRVVSTAATGAGF